MDLEHIDHRFRHIATLPDENRLHFIKSHRWIAYPIAKKVLQELEDLVMFPKQTRMPSLLLIGQPNNGKSSILEKFFELHAVENDNNEDQEPSIPVIKIEASKPDIKQFYIELLTAFWTPFRATQTATVFRQQAIHVMRDCKLKVLMIDEFHSLLNGTPRQQREVMNEIKYLTNVLKISVVGAGTQEAVRILHTDPQHASRFDLIQLPLWKWNKSFLQLLLSFERGLPLRKPSNLVAPDKAKLILSISQGVLGNIHSLLKRCAAEAIKNGSEEISLSLLEDFKWHTPTRGNREMKL